jgi:hypothetical protein
MAVMRETSNSKLFPPLSHKGSYKPNLKGYVVVIKVQSLDSTSSRSHSGSANKKPKSIILKGGV